MARVVLYPTAMKLSMGTNVYKARLRFSPRFQTWVIAVGPVQISREGLETQHATLQADSPLEERQLAEAGFVAAPAPSKAA
jgi:hypothetical protein